MLKVHQIIKIEIISAFLTLASNRFFCIQLLFELLIKAEKNNVTICALYHSSEVQTLCSRICIAAVLHQTKDITYSEIIQVVHFWIIYGAFFKVFSDCFHFLCSEGVTRKTVAFAPLPQGFFPFVILF